MVVRRLEQVFTAVQGTGEWFSGAADVVAEDLASDEPLVDLLHSLVDDDGTADAVLRASRVPRVRPVLVALAARAGGASAVDQELQYASELLFAALAVHDAALGPSGGRRRRLARRVLKRSVNWIGGNQLLLRAMELAHHTPSPEVLGEVLDALRAFGEGQQIASEVTAGAPPTRVLWEEHADRHTGALFAFCCRAGGHLAANGAGEVGALGRYGRHLGRMWHVAEDVALLTGPEGAEHLAGRAVIGRPMLPVALGMQRDPQVAALWSGLLESFDPAAAAVLLERLRRVRAMRGTREAMIRESWAARQALARLPDTPYRHALERLASGLSKAPFDLVVARLEPRRT